MSNNPEDLLKNPEQIKQMISLLSSLLDKSEEAEQSVVEEPPKKKTARKRTSKKTAKKAVKQSSNKFDSMTESGMFKENPDVAKKLYSNPPIKRRPKKNLVKARCRICGKEEQIPASLIYNGLDRYKCNRCSSSAG